MEHIETNCPEALFALGFWAVWFASSECVMLSRLHLQNVSCAADCII